MKYIYTLFFLISSSAMHGQFREMVQYIDPNYHKVEMYMKDGDTIKGYAEVPTGRKTIRFQTSTSDDVQRLDCDDIDQLKYITADGITYFFKRARNRVFVGKNKEHIYKREGWFYLLKTHELLNLYQQGGSVEVIKGEMVLTNGNGYRPEYEYYYFQRPGEDYVTHITSKINGGLNISRNKRFRKYAIRFFDDTPKLQIRIEEKEFKADDLNNVFNAYVLEKKKNIEG